MPKDKSRTQHLHLSYSEIKILLKDETKNVGWFPKIGCEYCMKNNEGKWTIRLFTGISSDEAHPFCGERIRSHDKYYSTITSYDYSLLYKKTIPKNVQIIFTKLPTIKKV